MDFQIQSATATNIVRLGESRDEVRRLLGNYRAFRRTPASEESDQFTERGVMATFSASGTLVMLEFVDPARVELEGVQLLGEPVEALESLLAERGIALESDGGGAVIPDLSVGLLAPSGNAALLSDPVMRQGRDAR